MSATVAEDNGDDLCSVGDVEAEGEEEEEREHTWKGNNESGHPEHRLELARQIDSDERMSDTEDVDEDNDEMSQSSYIRLPDDRRRPGYDNNDNSSEKTHSTNSEQAFRKDREKQKTQVS